MPGEELEQMAQIITSTQADIERASALTPEVVRQIADKVYALLLRDMQIERERLRMHKRVSGASRGGW